MNYTLADLDTIARTIGRAAIFYASPNWGSGSADLTLTHLGDTEGGIDLNRNEDYSILRVPEVTGPSKIKVYYKGEDPVFSISGLWFAQAALRALLSPTANASAGYERQREPTYRTLVVFPEQLFYDPSDVAFETLAYTTASGWSLGGTALASVSGGDHARLLDFAIWCWKGYFSKPNLAFQDEDAGKALGSIEFNMVRDGNRPDGHQLYTVGDPADASITIDVA